MRVAVCEDDKETCVYLAGRVRSLMPDAQVSVHLSAEELMRAEPIPDIILLDIELGAMSGIEAARTLRERGSDCAVIFVSGRDEYVFDAFDVDATHFLTKPVDEEKLAAVLSKASEKLAAARGSRWDRQLVVSSNGQRVRVHVDDIRYAEVFNRTIVLHTRAGTVSYYGRLSDLAEQCGADFCRTHRAYLVNLRHVESYSAAGANIGGATIPIAKKRYPAFVSQFTDYIRRLGRRP